VPDPISVADQPPLEGLEDLPQTRELMIEIFA
jgi:hypothetical protein